MKQRPHGGRPGRVAPGGVEQAPKEKSAWLLDTAEADQIYQTLNERSLPAADDPVNEAPKLPEAPMDFGAMREQFARRGHVLTRSRRVGAARLQPVRARQCRASLTFADAVSHPQRAAARPDRPGRPLWARLGPQVAHPKPPTAMRRAAHPFFEISDGLDFG